jgi:iron complex transport system permease protein
VPLAAFIGAFSALFSVIAISGASGGFSNHDIIIAGIIISSLLSSGVSFIKMLAGENVSAIVFWIMGSLSAKSWQDATLLLPVLIVCVVISLIFSRQLDIMSLGDENAKALGVNVEKIRLIYLVSASVMTAVCVCVCGVIGFVGLIVPHILRFSLSAKNSVLIPLSALFGAFLLLLADSITRIFSKGEIPVGVLTTLIGGPFFIFVFICERKCKNR